MTKSELALFWRRLALMIGLAGFIVLAFLGIGEWYTRTLNEDKTIVLDRSLFEDSGLSRIDTMIRRYSAQPIEELQTLKNGTVLVRLRGDDKLAVFDLANDKIIPLIDNEPVYTMSVSPDGTSILYGTVGKNKMMQTVWYDVAGKKEIARWNYWSEGQVMLDDRHVISEVKPGYIGIRDLETETVQQIINIIKTPVSFRGNWLIATASVLSQDKTRLYIPVYGSPIGITKDKAIIDSLCQVNLETGIMSVYLKGPIDDFIPLNDGKLVYSGQVNGAQGLYLQSENAEPELLKKGVYANLAYNPENGMLAFVDRGDGRWKVMAAKLSDTGLSDQFTVYDNLGYIRSLQWSADGKSLIGVTEESAGSYVYQFRIK